jgi:glycosyltransferase involved in cell wall biosynthesis
LSDDFDVFVVAPHAQNAKKTEKIDGVRIFRFQYFWPACLERLAFGSGIINNLKSNPLLYFQIPFFLFAEYFAARKIIRKEKIDIIHTHWLLPSGIVGVYLKKFYKIPLLVTAHCADVNNITSFFGKKLLKIVVKNSDFLITTNKQLKESLEKFCLKTPIKVIPMGVDTKLFAPGVRKSKSSQTILLAGRLLEHKGFSNVILALPAILKKFPDVKLLIAGSGKYKNNLISLCRKLGVEKSVKFLGWIDNKKMPGFLQSGDIFVLPTTTYEGSPVVLLEAASVGLPIIASKISGVDKIVIDKKNGILIPKGNVKALQKEIINLFENPKKMKELSQNSRQHIKENYGWNKIASKFKAVLKDIIKTRKK